MPKSLTKNTKKLSKPIAGKLCRLKGAKVQRLLWASTSTKDPSYSDVMYVDELVGPDTVNTLPPSTIEACADHCDVDNRIETGVEEAYQPDRKSQRSRHQY